MEDILLKRPLQYIWSLLRHPVHASNINQVKHSLLDLWVGEGGGASNLASVNIGAFKTPTQLSIVPDSKYNYSTILFHFL